MSTTGIIAQFKVAGIAVDADTAVMSDQDTGLYGVKRNDNDAVVVAVDTAATKIGTGLYLCQFTDPADDLTYDYSFKFTYGGKTIWHAGQWLGGADGSSNLYDLLEDVRVEVGGGPTDNFVKKLMRRVARDFCRKTHAWVEQLATISSTAGDATEQLTSAYDAHILAVKEVKIDTVPWEFESVSQAGLLTLDPAPGEDSQDIDVKVALLPDEDCASYHTWFIDRWGDAIVSGTVFRLKAMSRKVWSDKDGAALAHEDWFDYIARAKGEEISERHRGADMVVMDVDFG